VLERVTIRATDREASEAFYGMVLRTLGLEQTRTDARDARWEGLAVRQADDGGPATRRLHIAFVAESRARVDEFWRTGTAAGYRDDGQPGLRPEYGPDYYGGFLLDPDGNSAEAVTHDTPRRGTIDHLWIRVADVAAAKAFYVAVAPQTGFALGDDEPERAQFVGESGSFSLVAGTPTEHVQMAFRAPDRATVEAFSAVATEAGRSLEPPAERVADDERAYAASALDPDGHHVQVVHHGAAG
jgi:predicted lactoylglutathione lyase